MPSYQSLLFCTRLLARVLTSECALRDISPSQRHPDEHPPRRDMLLAHVRVQSRQSSLLPFAANEPPPVQVGHHVPRSAASPHQCVSSSCEAVSPPLSEADPLRAQQNRIEPTCDR